MQLIPFRTSYKLNNQDDGDAIFFLIVKMVHPDTRDGCSDIKTKIDTMKMYQFKRSTSNANLHISERMSEISIARESYSENFRQTFNL